MKFRSTLILLLLAVGLFAYIWFVERNRPTTGEARDQSQRVAKIDRDDFDAITIKNPEGKIELRKKDHVWFLEEPVKDRADSMAISQLFTTVETLKHDEAIGADGKGPGKEQLNEFGLGDPDTKVRFAGKEKPVEFHFGKDAAVEGKIYVKLDGKPAVYVIGHDLKNQLTKKADDFRDKKLTDLSTGLLTKAIIKTAQGEIEVEKKDKHWRITRPLNARGDDAKIGDVLSQATTARIESFVADSGNPSAYGLQEPRGTVTLYSEGREQPAILQIGANPKEEKDKEKTYAKLNTRDSVVLLPKSIETLLETKPNDLRDKNLIRVESDIVDRLTIEAPGKEKIVLARSGETWVRKTDKDVPINAGAASRLLTTLQTQQVAGFVADVATDLPKYGLDQPQLKVTLSSYASENTAETKAGEKPIAAILFGKVEGENVYAKVDEEPFIVSVQSTLLQEIYTDPLEWQELTIYKFQPEEITGLEITRVDQPTLVLQRDKENPWKLTVGEDKLNQNNVQSLVNTLARLRAVRWAGAATPEHGLDKPEMVITFKTAAGTGGKLTIGAKTPEELWHAIADGFTGTFLVSRPDMQALQHALIDKPVAPAAPGEPGTPPAALTPAESTIPSTPPVSAPPTPPASPGVEPASPPAAPPPPVNPPAPPP